MEEGRGKGGRRVNGTREEGKNREEEYTTGTRREKTERRCVG
jgi:hypothetical protein